MTLSKQYQIKCPVCSQSDQVILIEDLYFGLIERDQNVITEYGIQPDQIKSILREICPPELTRLPFWLIVPPDQLMIAILVALVLITILFIEQTTGGFLQHLILPVLFLVLYLFSRKLIYSKYIYQKNIREKELDMVQNAVNKWSSYFICLDDRTVFSGHNDNSFPLLELQKRLYNHR
jgi:hypothetical protein